MTGAIRRDSRQTARVDTEPRDVVSASTPRHAEPGPRRHARSDNSKCRERTGSAVSPNCTECGSPDPARHVAPGVLCNVCARSDDWAARRPEHGWEHGDRLTGELSVWATAVTANYHIAKAQR